VAKETKVTLNQTKLDSSLAIKGEMLNASRIYGSSRKSRFEEQEAQLLPAKFDNREVYGCVLENKVVKDESVDDAMVEGLQQALDYRSNIECNADTVWLTGTVCQWQPGRHLKVMVRYGAFAKDNITIDDLTRVHRLESTTPSQLYRFTKMPEFARPNIGICEALYRCVYY
jgi:hypothetical protein